MMRETKVEKYATMQYIHDEADDETIAAMKLTAARNWRDLAAHAGYQPINDDEPTDAQVATAFFPTYAENPETGEKVKLPDRILRIAGYVVPSEVPLPPEGFRAGSFKIDVP